ncbi:MAG TPA: ABC transporter ATP-binding protein [Candidatus Saccharimonadales bacterium]|nr:ABC transporter ATP-binding protein [Candidatus Saccharimonadales bacterium]
MAEPAIVVHDLHKEFVLPQHKLTSLKQVFVNLGRKNSKKRQKVLDGINFTINKGEFVGIVGRNGSGKSTLLKILAGVYAPTVGSVTVHGSLTPFIELGVGFNPELSGRDNVFLNGALLGFSHKEMEAMYDDIVSFAELGDFMEQKLKNYSSGMQVRLAFSIAVRAKSDILLLDEVLAVGDAAFQQKCFNYFEELKAAKQTVVFVSHDMGAVRRFCTKAIYVANGKIIQEGAPSDVADLYAEKNIEQYVPEEEETKQPEERQLPAEFSVRAKITAQDNESLVLRISYRAPADIPVYTGIALMKDGVSIAEIITPLDKPLHNKGSVTYMLDKTILNPGMYAIGGVSLFKLDNLGLVAVGKSKLAFTVKGNDMTRGGALKLKDNWAYDED